MIVNKPQRSFSLRMANSVHFTMEKKEVEAFQLGEEVLLPPRPVTLLPEGWGQR